MIKTVNKEINYSGDFIKLIKNNKIKRIYNKITDAKGGPISLIYPLLIDGKLQTKYGTFDVKMGKIKSIYKTFRGFINEESIKEFLQSKYKHHCTWMSCKEIAIAYSLKNWYGCVAFKVIKDLVLIDFGSRHNIKLISKLTNLLEFSMTMGCDVTEKQQIEYLRKKTKWKEIWYTPSSDYKKTNNLTVDLKKTELNPINFPMGDKLKKKVMKFLTKIPLVDGWIQPEMFASLNPNGESMEEVVLNKHAFVNKLKLDEESLYHWKNYQVDDYDIASYHLSEKVISLYEDRKPKNENFQIMRFTELHDFITSNMDFYRYKILFYNVHMFEDITVNEEVHTAPSILSFIKDIKPGIVALAEYKHHKDTTYFYDEMKKIYPFSYSRREINSIMVFSRYRLEGFHIQTSKRRFQFMTDDICFVHLEVGNEIGYPKQDHKIRIEELKKIVSHRPKYIMGDFNFTVDYPSEKYLSKHYRCISDSKTKTTPFNNVDRVYARLDIHTENAKCRIYPFVYSDHLPLAFCKDGRML